MGGRGRSVIKVGRLSPTSITTQGPSGERETSGSDPARCLAGGAERGTASLPCALRTPSPPRPRLQPSSLHRHPVRFQGFN